MQTIHDIRAPKQSLVMIRTDFNVPYRKDGTIASFDRINSSIKTINYLRERDYTVVITSHIASQENTKLRHAVINNIRHFLQEILCVRCTFIPQTIFDFSSDNINNSCKKSLYIFDDIRQSIYEKNITQAEKDLSSYFSQMTSYVSAYVLECFPVMHRNHTSLSLIPKYVPTYIGYNALSEYQSIQQIINCYNKSVSLIIIGGKKISTKISFIKYIIDTSSYIFLGGGMANTFLATKYDIGKSFYEKESMSIASDLLQKAKEQNCHLILPQDFVVENNDGQVSLRSPWEIRHNEKIMDIGPHSLQEIDEILDKCTFALWNGPVGLYEKKRYERGSKEIAHILIKHKRRTGNKLFSVVGGGDTICVTEEIHDASFSYVSTGGGSFLELFEKKKFPCIDTLLKREK